jgi:hypothetical protein
MVAKPKAMLATAMRVTMKEKDFFWLCPSFLAMK